MTKVGYILLFAMKESSLFTYFPEPELKQLLTVASSCLGLPMIAMDEQGTPVIKIGKIPFFCHEAMKCDGVRCVNEHLRAGFFAVHFGSVYMFSCRFGLHHILYPLIYRGRQFGSVLTGAFHLGNTPEDIPEMPKDPFIEGLGNDFAHYYKDIRIFTPKTALEISQLLDYLFRGFLAERHETQTALREKSLQQSKINEAIQKYKFENITQEYPLEKEKALLSYVKAGNMESAKAVFNDLLGGLLLYEKYDMDNIKVRLVEICSLLSRNAIDRGADNRIILEMNKKLIRGIMATPGIEELGYFFQDNLEIFTETLFFSSEKNNRLMKEAASYLHVHFPENVSLAGTAEHINANPSYLSRLFRQTTGMTFREYLNMIRIEEAKRLLSATDYPVSEIAIACGFSDQSHFARVFKKSTGLTPKNYR